jgi:hypothetical protein
MSLYDPAAQVLADATEDLEYGSRW